MKGGDRMPRKRPLEQRIREHEDKMDKLKLEKAIKDLKEKIPVRRRPRRTGTR